MNASGPANASFFAQFQRILASRDRDAIARFIEQAVANEYALGARWLSLAQVAKHDYRPDLTSQCLIIALSQNSGNPQLVFQAAVALAEVGDIEAARAALRRLPPTIPDPASNAHFAGTLELQIGQVDTARDYFQQAIDNRPTSGASWLAYVATMRDDVSLSELSRVIDAAPLFARAAAPDRAAYQYALGDALHRLREPDRAFDAFRRGAKLLHQTRPFRSEEDRAAARSALWPRTLRAETETSTDRPIFVIGLPRSGTTLLQQILTAHPDVTEGGEFGAFDATIRAVGGHTFQDLANALGRCSALQLAAPYLDYLRYRFAGSGRIVDKSINLSRYIGPIAALMPNAPLIWIRRDPLDCAWSCFRTFFSTGIDWSWSLTDIAEHFRLEDAVFHHWQELLGDRLLAVSYEALVTRPEETIAALLRHCGLSRHAAPFAHQYSVGTVATASVLQVRQPINRKGIGAAERYRRHLQPFIDAYYG